MLEKPNLLKEYISNLSDDDIKFLESRLNQRLSGDIPEVLNFLEKNSKVDFILSKTKTANELYDLVDAVAELVKQEIVTRNS